MIDTRLLQAHAWVWLWKWWSLIQGNFALIKVELFQKTIRLLDGIWVMVKIVIRSGNWAWNHKRKIGFSLERHCKERDNKVWVFSKKFVKRTNQEVFVILGLLYRSMKKIVMCVREQRRQRVFFFCHETYTRKKYLEFSLKRLF